MPICHKLLPHKNAPKTEMFRKAQTRPNNAIQQSVYQDDAVLPHEENARLHTTACDEKTRLQCKTIFSEEILLQSISSK